MMSDGKPDIQSHKTQNPEIVLPNRYQTSQKIIPDESEQICLHEEKNNY